MVALTRAFRALTLVGYFAVLVLILGHCTLWAPPSHAPVSVILVIAVGPLLVPLRGLLHARRYTHAWTSLVALLYFLVGVITATASTPPAWLGGAEIAASLVLFTGAVGYVRCRAVAARAAG